jgi:hypothetical protein
MKLAPGLSILFGQLLRPDGHHLIESSSFTLSRASGAIINNTPNEPSLCFIDEQCVLMVVNASTKATITIFDPDALCECYFRLGCTLLCASASFTRLFGAFIIPAFVWCFCVCVLCFCPAEACLPCDVFSSGLRADLNSFAMSVLLYPCMVLAEEATTTSENFGFGLVGIGDRILSSFAVIRSLFHRESRFHQIFVYSDWTVLSPNATPCSFLIR